MILTTPKQMRVVASYFHYSIDTLENMLRGQKGEKKQLLAMVILYFTVRFIQSVENDTYTKQKGIKYLSDKDIMQHFGFRLSQLEHLRSKRKALLLECLRNTPDAVLQCCKSIIGLSNGIETLFPLFRDELNQI